MKNGEYNKNRDFMMHWKVMTLMTRPSVPSLLSCERAV